MRLKRDAGFEALLTRSREVPPADERETPAKHPPLAKKPQGAGHPKPSFHLLRSGPPASIGPSHPLVVGVFSLLPVKLVALPRIEY